MNRRILAPLLAVVLAVWTGCSSDEDECPAGQVRCQGSCVDTQSNAGHCGACGNVCDAGLVCHQGACVCPQGMSLCDGECVDTESNASHCGGCGVVCLGETPCVGGSCGCDGDDCGCSGLLCGEERTCVDHMNDNQNCGACGVACGKAQHCVGGTCSMGDLFVACKEAGTIGPFLKRSLEESGFTVDQVGGPSSMALFGSDYLLVTAARDAELRVIDRHQMLEIAAVPVGAQPVHVVVRGQRAYVLSQGEHAIDVIDLSDPSDPRIAYRATNNDQMPAGSKPAAAAFLTTEELDRTLWVSLQGSDKLVPVTMGDRVFSFGQPVVIPTAMMAGKPAPTGITAIGVDVYAAIGNMRWDGRGPAGNALLFRYRRGLVEGEFFDLGEDCKEARHLAQDGERIYVACKGSGQDDGAVVIFDPRLAIPLSKDDEVEPPDPNPALEVIPLGGAPERIAVDPSRPGWIYIADSSGNEFAVLSPERELRRVVACPAIEGEQVADVVVVP